MTAVRVRIAAGVVVALLLAVLPLLVRPAAPTAEATGVGDGQVAAVGRSALVCPTVGSSEDVRSTVTAGAWPTDLDPALAASLAGREGEVTTTWLGGSRGSSGAGSSGTPGAAAPALESLGYIARGVRVTASAPAGTARGLTIVATGELAPGAAATQLARASDGTFAGLAEVACTAPGTDFWFAGLSEDTGQHADIVLNNIDGSSSTVDIELFDEKGKVGSGDGALTVPAQSQVTLDLDNLAPGSRRLAAHVHVTTGRLAVAARQVSTSGDRKNGYDWLAPMVEPARSLVVPGVVAGADDAVLTLFAPGTDTAEATIELLGPNGPFRAAGHESVTLTPGEVRTIDLGEAFDGNASAVRVTSDVALVAGMQVTDVGPTGQSPGHGDLAMLAPGAPVVSSVAVPGQPKGTEGTLLVTSTGSAVKVKVDVLGATGAVASTESVEVGASSTATFKLPASATGGTVLVTVPQADAVVVARAVTATVNSGKVKTPQLTVLQPAPPQIEAGRSALVRTLR